MQQRPKRKLIVLLCLVVACLTNHLLSARLTPDGLKWQAHDAEMHINLVLAIAYCIYVTSYREIDKKCALFAWLGFEIVSMFQSIIFVFGISISRNILPFEILASVFFVYFYAFRSYSHKSDEIDDEHIFLCRKKPKTVQGVLLSMLTPSAMGGVGVFYKGSIYHFSAGVLTKNRFTNNDNYVVTRLYRPTITTIDKLEGLIGTKWTIRQNCLTVLLWTAKTGSPLFRAKRPTS